MAVDLEAYARGIEADLADLRNTLAPLEAGNMKFRSREYGGEWKDVTDEIIAFDRKVIATYETILKDVRARIEGRP
jgi:hypothetical protein